jgi:hypothetical protein
MPNRDIMIPTACIIVLHDIYTMFEAEIDQTLQKYIVRIPHRQIAIFQFQQYWAEINCENWWSCINWTLYHNVDTIFTKSFHLTELGVVVSTALEFWG